MDNTNVQNYWNRGSGSGQLGTTLGVEAIAEYQVLTNTYSAQFGGNGVAINAITKSGTNQWHGSLFEYYRNDRLDASNYFDALLDRPDPTLEKNQFGGSSGGPLVRNKAFYFVTYEGLRQTIGQTQAINVPGRQRPRRGHQRRERRRASRHCAGAAAVPAADAADAGPGGPGNRAGRRDQRDAGRRELLRRPHRLHGQQRHQPVRPLHGRRGVGLRAELRLGDPALEQPRRDRQPLLHRPNCARS